ncbi:CsgG/HfaB family protein [Candidatus Cloacimonadota bacterium]
MRHLKLMVFIITIILLISCGTTSMKMTLLRPAKINLSDYRQIAVDEIIGKIDEHTKDIADQLADILVETGRFKVLDRQNLEKIMKEHQLDLSSPIDEATVPELGEIIGTAVVLFGRIQTDSYNETLSKGDPWIDNKGRTHQNNIRDGIYNLVLELKFVDIETSKLISAETIIASEKLRTIVDSQRLPFVEKGVLYRKCLKKIMDKYTKLVAPYEVKVEISFETHKQLPEVDEAIALFKIGSWTRGLSILKKATMKPDLNDKIRAKAYFDLGLAQMYNYKNKLAINSLQQALKLHPKSKYERALDTARKEAAKSEELKKQIDE